MKIATTLLVFLISIGLQNQTWAQVAPSTEQKSEQKTFTQYKTEVQISLEQIKTLKKQVAEAKASKQGYFTTAVVTGVLATAGLLSLIKRYPNEFARFKTELDVDNVRGMYAIDGILVGTTSVAFFSSYYMLRIKAQELNHFQAELEKAEKQLEKLNNSLQEM